MDVKSRIKLFFKDILLFPLRLYRRIRKGGTERGEEEEEIDIENITVKGRIPPEVLAQMPEKMQKEIGELKAELSKERRKRKELEEEKEGEKTTIVDRAKEKKRVLDKEERERMIKVSDIKGSQVLSKEHKPLGRFEDLVFIESDNSARLGVVVSVGEDEYVVHESSNLSSLIHRPEGISGLKRGAPLILMRTWEGKYEPDMSPEQLQSLRMGYIDDEEVEGGETGPKEAISQAKEDLKEDQENIIQKITDVGEEKGENKEKGDIVQFGVEYESK